MAHSYTGYQWWGVSGFASSALAVGAYQAAPAIDTFIDRKLDQYGLTEANLVLVGLRRQAAIAAIVGYSGMLTDIKDIARTDFAKPPALLVHGTADPASHLQRCI